MAVEVLKQQLADLTRDYTGACEAIRQLEANVAAYRDKLDDLTEQRADLQQDRARLRAARDAALLNHTAALLEVGRMRDETIALREQLTAAEAAREAVLASLAAAEAVAGEVREMAEGAIIAEINYKGGLEGSEWTYTEGERSGLRIARTAVSLMPLPTPSAALQRVREQAQREGAEQFLAALDAEMDARAEVVDVDLGDAFGAGYDQAHADFHGAGPQIMARLFPTPDAGGPA